MSNYLNIHIDHEKCAKTPFDANYDYLMKVVIIGDSCVGKSVLMQRYVDGTFPVEPYVSTIGVDFNVKRLAVDNPDGKIKLDLYDRESGEKRKQISPHPFKIKLQIWDTAGQERFRAITQSYYRGMRICVLCFDTSRTGLPGSIQNVRKWLDDVKRYAGDNTYVYVVGTKADTVDALFEQGTLIESIESYDGIHVKFMGWCSSKYDTYVKKPEDFIRIKQTRVNRYLSNEIEGNAELKSDKCLTLCDMFDEIILDFLNKESNFYTYFAVNSL